MSRHIILLNWTDQGIKTIDDSPSRFESAKAVAKIYGCAIREFYLTIGSVDIVAIIDSPDDVSFAKFNMALRSSGNVASNVLKAFDMSDYKKIFETM